VFGFPTARTELNAGFIMSKAIEMRFLKTSKVYGELRVKVP